MQTVVLRAVTDADVAILYEHQRDPEAARMAGLPSRDRDAHDEHWRRIRADPSVDTHAIVAAGELVGHVVTFERDGRRLVGYWLAREHWGKGIASAALARFLDDTSTRPLYAEVEKHNVASQRVLEKCGFGRLDEENGGLLVFELRR